MHLFKDGQSFLVTLTEIVDFFQSLKKKKNNLDLHVITIIAVKLILVHLNHEVFKFSFLKGGG